VAGYMAPAERRRFLKTPCAPGRKPFVEAFSQKSDLYTPPDGSAQFGSLEPCSTAGGPLRTAPAGVRLQRNAVQRGTVEQLLARVKEHGGRLEAFDCAHCGKRCEPGVNVPPNATRFCSKAHKRAYHHAIERAAA
jgi:hypothetical protein